MLNKKKVVITTIIIIAIIAIIIVPVIRKRKDKMENKASVSEVENNNNGVSEPTNPDIEYNNEIPIMCYHGVLDDAWGDESIFVKVDEFERQMKYLSENGYTTLFISEIEDANKYEKPIIITFDDGYRDVYTYAFPILKKYNIKADLYIISGYLGGEKYLTIDMVKELAQSSLIEFGSHTITHSILTKVSDEELERQLSESKKMIEELTGKKVESMAYPTGAYNSKVMEAVKKYYKCAISIEEGKENPKAINTYELKRLYMDRDYGIEKFKEMIEN